MEGELIAGRFAVEEKIGTGAMGTVHRARDMLTGQLVALKVLHAPGEHAERFAREAAAIAEISHPGAVRYVAHGILSTGEPFLAMQWIEGETLAKRLQRGKLSIRDTLILGRRIAAALGAAHARKLVHRDVKPANVMLAGGAVDTATLVDFGLARRSTSLEVTRTNMLVGTPAYIAPEQARGDDELDVRSDLYSLGITLFHLATGRVPFTGKSQGAILVRHILEEVPDPRSVRSDLSESFAGILHRLTRKRPEDRFASAEAAAEAIEAVLAVRPATARIA